jgi:hypothetical protein
MRQETFFENNQGLYFGDKVKGSTPGQSALSSQLDRLGSLNLSLPRQTAIGLILIIALLAFEIFNFDTTQYALRDLLGDVSFIGLGWATILAIAFCAIDFAGLAHMFAPNRGVQTGKEVWYLMGAWLLGATMNALMTWWAISLTLLNHQFGNEVLSREQLLQIAPIFVAVLVWLTRILFIGAFSVAGDHLFNSAADYPAEMLQPAARPAAAARPAPRPAATRPATTSRPVMSPQPVAAAPKPAAQTTTRQSPTRPAQGNGNGNGRVRQRPPRPAAMVARQRR